VDLRRPKRLVDRDLFGGLTLVVVRSLHPMRRGANEREQNWTFCTSACGKSARLLLKTESAIWVHL
jgi:hypothetical protein